MISVSYTHLDVYKRQDFFEVLIIHMNVVVFFEAIIDRAIVFQIWIVWIDVLFRNIGLVEDIRIILYLTSPFDLIVELRWIEA